MKIQVTRKQLIEEEITSKDGTSIYDVVQPIHALSRYLGVTPFRLLPGVRDPGPIATYILFAILKTIVSIYFILNSFEFSRINDIYYEGSDLLNIGHVLSITVSIIQSIVSNILNILVRHTYVKIYIEIYQHDIMLEKLGEKIPHEKAMRRVRSLNSFLFVFSTLFCVLMVTYFSFTGKLSVNAFLVGGLMILNFVSFTLSTFHFYFLLSTVGRRLKLLNNCIRWVGPQRMNNINCIIMQLLHACRNNFGGVQTDVGVSYVFSVNVLDIMLAKIARLHAKLVRIITLINYCMSFQVMWFICIFRNTIFLSPNMQTI